MRNHARRISAMRSICAVLFTTLLPFIAAAQEEVPSVTAEPAWNPYLVGMMIGVLSWFTFYFSQKPIGASAAYAKVVGIVGNRIAPKHINSIRYYRDDKPKVDWEVTFVICVIAGAFVAAWSGGELTGRLLPPFWVEHFGDSTWLRLSIAFAGGILLALGARMAGGCTSGHGISGTMQLSLASWISLISFFIGGVVTAFLLYYV